MNWEAIGAIGEVVGALGVIVTLVYLTVQLRQNTSALRANTWQSIQEAEQRFDEFLSKDPSLVKLWLQGAEHGIDSLPDPAQRLQFYLLGKQLLDQFQTHHYHHERKLIDTELWQTWEATFIDDTRKWPGYTDVIRERHNLLRPSFAQFVAQHVKLNR